VKPADLKRRIDAGKYSVARVYPEIGTADPTGMVMDIFALRDRVAVVLAGDREGGYQYHVVTFRVAETVDSGDVITVVERRDWPVTTWRFVRLVGAAAAQWDLEHDDYDDAEDAAEEQALETLEQLEDPPAVALRRFSVVRWQSLASDQPSMVPAGVGMRRADGTGLDVSAFRGFEGDAQFWRERYTFVPENFLADINHASGRDEMFSKPEFIRAPSFEEALDRAKYEFAKDHFAETGRSLY